MCILILWGKTMFKIIWTSMILQMKQSWARGMYRFCLAIQPIIYVIMMYAMYSISESQNFMQFVVLGTGLITLWSTIAFSSASDLDRERKMGTLKGIFCAPTDYRVVIFSKVLGNTVLGVIPMLCLMVFTYLARPDLFIIAHTGWFAISFLAMVLSFVSISLIFSALFTISRETRIFMNCLEYPIFILCGITFPISYIPVGLRWLSYLLSPTWSVELLRETIGGISDFHKFYFMLFILLILTISHFIIAYWMLGIVVKKVRVLATLEVD